MIARIENGPKGSVSCALISRPQGERLEITYGGLREKQILSIAASTFEEPKNFLEMGWYWLKSFTWRVLSLTNARGEKEKVWVNINSATKQMASKGIGIEKERIADYLREGTLIEQLEKQLKLQESYAQALGCTPQVAIRGLETLKKCHLESGEIGAILDFIKNYREFYFALAKLKAKKKKEACCYVTTKPKNGEEAAPHRALMFTAGGEIYVNLSKKRDYLVGKGTFKKAKLSCKLNSGELFLKMSQEVTPRNPIEGIYNEIKMSNQLGSHPSLVGIEPDTVSVVYSRKAGRVKVRWIAKFCNGGDLREALNRNSFPSDEKRLIAKSLLEGAAYLHHKNIIHRDLKPSNIFLERNVEGGVINARIGDFGFAFEAEDAAQKKFIGGTCAYMAPELFNKAKTPQEVNERPLDCWALGCILYELYKGESSLPWMGLTTLEEKSRLIASFQREKSPEIQKLHGSKDPIDQVIYGFLDENPQTRLSIGAALNLLSMQLSEKPSGKLSGD